MAPKTYLDQGRRRVCPGRGIRLEIFFAKVRVASSNLVARSKQECKVKACFLLLTVSSDPAPILGPGGAEPSRPIKYL
ncbi:MAG: hypothetical protein QOH48_1427 [Actinomycetota bacterium]|jgi:hypothetical protein|nr:hypothetical protein [Actinomycetota bacterium]